MSLCPQMVTMKIRRPYTTASIWSSGKVTVTGATTEEYAHIAARRIARSLQNMGFKTRFANYRVVNVLGSCTMPFNIKIAPFSERHRKNARSVVLFAFILCDSKVLHKLGTIL